MLSVLSKVTQCRTDSISATKLCQSQDWCITLDNVATAINSTKQNQLHTTRPSTQSLHIWSSGFFCRGSGCLELPERQTAWTAVNCEQFQTVT